VIIVVSGTHASGKTSLIDEFAAAHAAFEVWPDPHELLDEIASRAGGSFNAQLQLTASRLMAADRRASVIAERGPIDFLAYLDALEVLGRPERAPGLFSRGVEICREAMAKVDLLVLLPLDGRNPIHVPDDEDPELRLAMNEALLELAEDEDLTGGATVVELNGTPPERLARLEMVVSIPSAHA
jgi:hypothetical protein